MNSNQRLRARIIFIFILLGGATLSLSLYWTQIVHGDEYIAKANKQYEKDDKALFDRGIIYFLSKDGVKTSAAGVKQGYTIFINPSILDNVDQTYEAISQYISINKEDFIKKASEKDTKYEILQKKVPSQTAKSIKALSIKGVGIEAESWRSYPGLKLASHTLGIVGESSSSGIEGRYGLEKSYESVLSRTTLGSEINVFAEIFTEIKNSVFGSSNQEGNIVTTIEPTLQGFVEDTLKDVNELWKPEETGAIIMNPMNGEIVAMAVYPDFDPNNLSQIKDSNILSNSLVEHVYEMGSILKPLTMAAGLDDGVIKPNSTYEDTGTMTLSGKKIANYDGKARGVVPMQEILSQSLNVGVANIALKIGKDDFSKYFLSFGIGDKTGIDLPNEAKGIAGNLKTGRDIEIATASYGQGIAMSPMAMIRALSILGNGGYLVRPHIVKEIEYEDGTSKPLSDEKTGPVLKKETVDDVTHMLVKVVDEALRKGALKMDRYSIAAKTGTAQIANPKGGGYYDDRYLHSFFGYFPAYNPKFIVFLYQVHPKGAQYASETLAEPFSKIAKFLIQYYNIPPDR